MTRGRIAVLLAVLGLGGAWAWTLHARKGEQPRFREVRVARGDLDVTILATGVVEPQNRVQIKPPIAGRAEEILAREGQAVAKGQILAWMSSTERAALLDAARARGADELRHWEEIYKPTPLIAPLAGLIIARKVEPGQTVTASDAVLVMSNRLIVKASVDETDLGRVQVGQAAEIVLDAYPAERVAARVDHIAYEAKTVSNVTVYEVDVVPERAPEFMRSGMTANVSFVVARKQGTLLLPSDAVRMEGGHSTVMVPAPDGESEPEPRAVETGATDGKRVEVLSGLAEGDRVLVRSFRLPAAGAVPGSPFSPFGSRPRGGRVGGREGGRERGAAR